MANEKDQTENDLKIEAAPIRLDQCHGKMKQGFAKLISKKKSETGAIQTADCDQQESRNMEESDQEMQESVIGSKEHYAKFMNLTMAAIFDQSENSKPAFHARVEAFSIKMYDLIHVMKSSFKKDPDGAKKTSVLKWLKEHAESNEDYEAIKAEAGILAIKLSSLLSTLMLLMLESKEMHAKLQVLKSSIKWLIEDADSMVTRMIVSVMEIIEDRVKEQRELMVESREQEPVCFDMTEGNQFERVLGQFFDGMKQFDGIIMHQLQTDSNESVNDLRSWLEAQMKLFEEELDAIQEPVNDRMELYDFIAGTDQQIIDAFRPMKLQIHPMLEEVWQSEVFADQTSE